MAGLCLCIIGLPRLLEAVAGRGLMSEWPTTVILEHNRFVPEFPFWAAVQRGLRALKAAVHIHEGFEIGMVLAGAERHLLGGSELAGEPGDTWLSAAWEPHGWRTLEEDTETVVVMFPPDFMGGAEVGGHAWDTLFGVSPEMRLVSPHPRERESLLALGLELKREIKEQAHGWQTGVRLGVLRLLLQISRHWQTGEYAFPVPSPHFAKLNRLAPAMRLLDGKPGRHVSLEEAARAANLSRSRFAVLFRRVAGVSFGEFCLQARMTHVERLLMRTTLSLEDIAAQTGFANASHLHRAFRKYHLCTPGQFRAETRGEV